MFWPTTNWRFKKVTGKRASLISTDQAFEDMEGARRNEIEVVL
jgi:hypothetical protein